MIFTPKSEEEIQAINLISPGTYDFEIVSARDKTSQSGNEMIELYIKIWDMNGKEHNIYDYLLEAVSYKLRHFAKATGQIDKYNNGCLNAVDCLNKSGKVEIIIQKGRPKPDGSGNYPDKNAVKDYIESPKTEAKDVKKTSNGEKFLDDDVPF